jgi:hypothetical protein
MTTITNTGESPVRVAGRYLQQGESVPVADEVAALVMANNPAVAVADAEPEKKPAVKRKK